MLEDRRGVGDYSPQIPRVKKMFPLMLAAETGTDLTELMALFLAYLLAIVCVMFLVHVVIAFFIYKDANNHGMNGAIWGAAVVGLVLVLWFLGILVYLIAVLVFAAIYLYKRDGKHGWRCIGEKCKRK